MIAETKQWLTWLRQPGNRDREVMRSVLAMAAPAEHPFGCVIVDWEHAWVLATANGTHTDYDPTGHCEMVAMRRMGGARQSRPDIDPAKCTLYSSHEPCIGCSGFIGHAQIGRVVFGSYRSDLPDLFKQKRMGCASILAECRHPVDVVGGVCRKEAISLFDGVERW